MNQAYGLYSHIRANRTRSVVLIGGLFLLVYLLVFAFVLAFNGFVIGDKYSFLNEEIGFFVFWTALIEVFWFDNDEIANFPIKKFLLHKAATPPRAATSEVSRKRCLALLSFECFLFFIENTVVGGLWHTHNGYLLNMPKGQQQQQSKKPHRFHNIIFCGLPFSRYHLLIHNLNCMRPGYNNY